MYIHFCDILYIEVSLPTHLTPLCSVEMHELLDLGAHAPLEWHQRKPVIIKPEVKWDKKCHKKQKLEPGRIAIKMILSLWNLTNDMAATLPRRLPNFKAVGQNTCTLRDLTIRRFIVVTKIWRLTSWIRRLTSWILLLGPAWLVFERYLFRNTFTFLSHQLWRTSESRNIGRLFHSPWR